MAADKLNTDVFKLMAMPLGPIWRERALIAIRAEDRARRDVEKRQSLARGKR